MKNRTDSLIHPPLGLERHDSRREEAEYVELPALTEPRSQRLHAEIAAFASEQAGTDLDLDKDLEQAGIEALLTSDWS